MTDERRITTLTNAEVEHGFGAARHRAYVLLRVIDEHGNVMTGHLPPEQAASFAVDLLTSAGRAEYEQDLHGGLKATGMDDEAIGMIMHTVRVAEEARHTSDE